MSKTLAIILSIFLSAMSGGAALAQYQDPRLAGQVDVNDPLDAIYDQINARCPATPA